MMDDIVFDKEFLEKTGLQTSVVPDLLFAATQPHVMGLYLSERVPDKS